MSFSQPDRDREYCRTISEAHEYIRRYISDMSAAEFLGDPKTQDATTMRLQQILECAVKISPDFRKNLKINWSSLTAMRNKISHSYVDIDAEIIWDVINSFEEFQKLIVWAKSQI